MQPLLTSAQIREADALTIAAEPISSVDLMERASNAFVRYFTECYPDKATTISVYCGTGNNGGDGLAIARILHSLHYQNINIKIARFSEKASDEFNTNLKRVKRIDLPVTEIAKDAPLPPEDGDLLIVALLGTGLNKPLQGDHQKLVNHINSLEKTVVAVDVPTGLFSDGEMPPEATVLKADLVITFQQPKISFLLPGSGPFIKYWKALGIGIDKNAIASFNSPYQFVEQSDIRKILKPRHRFSNKGTYGHALMIAGEPETMGAALLCSSAAVYAGAGLTTACVPQSGLTALNTYMPEIMAIVRTAAGLPEIKWDSFTAIGIGPGLGKGDGSMGLLMDVLTNYKKPLVIDADALNLLATHKQAWAALPENSILTPHMKEFDRLFGDHENWWQRVQTGVKKAAELKLHILLKNDYTMIFTPQGKVYFNSTSNAAMATGGMGDVLTGIITSLLAQKYTSEEACIAGAYLHGLAGDELALPHQLHMVLPAQLAAQLPATMAKLMA